MDAGTPILHDYTKKSHDQVIILYYNVDLRLFMREKTVEHITDNNGQKTKNCWVIPSDNAQ